MKAQYDLNTAGDHAEKIALNERLESFGWAALLITVGTIWLLPERQVPRGSWLMAAGVILLGLNAIRYLNGIRMRGFSVVAGAVALLAGLGAYFNWNLPLLPIVLIVIGACMLLMPLLEKNSVCSSPRDCCWGHDDTKAPQGRTAVGR